MGRPKKFKGPSKFRRTNKRGTIAGLILGAVLWYVQRNPSDPLAPTGLFLGGAFFIVALIIGLAAPFRGKAILTPFGDGFVFGITISFDILVIVSTGRIF